MTHLHLSWEKDLKFKLRFLELLFLITTLLVALNPQQVNGLLGNSLLLFVVFGSLHYFLLSNGILESRIIISVALITSMAFSAVFGTIFFNLEILEFGLSVLYWLIMSLVIGAGIMPRKTVDSLARKTRL
ncbi:MAG: hypothetical protein ACI9LV_000491 [Candidatus Nanohaloarchaea archaeon]|jgi:hypothetical protein